MRRGNEGGHRLSQIQAEEKLVRMQYTMDLKDACFIKMSPKIRHIFLFLLIPSKNYKCNTKIGNGYQSMIPSIWLFKMICCLFLSRALPFS